MNGAHGQIVHHHVVLELTLVHEHVLSNTMEWTVMGCQLRTVTANNHHVRTVGFVCLVCYGGKCYGGKDVGLLIQQQILNLAKLVMISCLNRIHFSS